MVDAADATARIETRKDFGSGDAALYAYWMGQEKIAEREERKWLKQSREIVKRYRDERPESIQNTHRFNIFWSNVETLKPVLYARTPKPDVQRTFKDDDPVGLFAAEILQRCLEYSCEAHEKHFDEVMKAVVEDRLLPGRAAARVLYVPHYGDVIKTPDGPENAEFEGQGAAPSTIDSDGDNPKEEKTAPEREVVYEEVVPKYLFWEDYREGPARQWDEVPWVRYRAYMTRDQLVARFGAKGKKVNLDYEPKGVPESAKTEPPSDLFKKACVHEIWDKDKKEVVWLAPGTPDVILDQDEDPLKLPGFFPNRRPLLANKTNDKRIPVPDFIQYQDQARELDRITARIDKLTGALQVKGFYPGEEKQALQQLIDEGTENRLIPIHDWQRFVDKGGIKDIIQWMPIQQIAECLIQLYGARDRTKAILYELTGMSDILRGQTSPIETKGAQDLKAAFATRRMAPKQKDVAEFACELIRAMGAIIAEHFSAKTISMISGFPQSQQVQVPQLPEPPPQYLPAQGPAPAMTGPSAAGPLADNGGAVAPGGPPSPGPAGPPAGQPQVPGQAMVAMQPNPAFQQWMQAKQARDQAVAKNNAAQQKFDAAVALIKKDGVHGFRIDIEADSTIAPDEEAEKQSRTEFLQQFVPFMQQMIPFAMGNPEAADFAEKLTLFAMRPFKVARNLEESVTALFEKLKSMPPPPPNGGKQGGADSPQDLAVRANETQSRERIANQQNAVKMQIADQQNTVKMAELQLSAKEHHDTLAAGISKEADQRAFRDIRGEAIQAREAGHLQ